tara:strand:- start:52 stop:1794 length:1743 start_codon:yes stop_codon:yes gene_type:complete
MNELEQATAAFMAADKAGDTENAQLLADYINSYEAPLEAPVEAPVEAPKTYGEQLMSIPELIPDAIDSLLKQTGERNKSRGETMKAVKSGRLPMNQGTASIGSSLVGGTAVDLVDGLTGMVIDTASLLIPDSVGQPVAEAFSQSANWVLSTEGGQWVTEALSGTMEDYDKFKQSSPEQAKLLEGAVNVALIMTPSPKSKPKMGGLDAAGRKLEESGKKGVMESKQKYVDKMLTPVETAKTRVDDLANTTISPITQKATVSQTTRQADVASLVRGITEVSPNKTLKNNHVVIRKEVHKRGDSLVNTLEKLEKNRAASVGHTGALQLDTITTRLTDDVAELVATNPLFRGDKAIIGAAEAMLEKTLQLLADNPLTPANVLRVRRELDDFIRSSKGSVFEAATENSVSIPFKTIRKSLNDIIDEAVPNAEVKKSLREQSMLYEALDTLAPKAGEEMKTIAGRLVQNISEVLPYNVTRNVWQANAAILGAGATTAAFTFPQLLPIMGGGLLATGMAKQLGKQALPSKSKVALGRMLQLTDKAIKATKDSSMKQVLHADRIYIANLLKNIATDNSEEDVPELLRR